MLPLSIFMTPIKLMLIYLNIKYLLKIQEYSQYKHSNIFKYSIRSIQLENLKFTGYGL